MTFAGMTSIGRFWIGLIPIAKRDRWLEDDHTCRSLPPYACRNGPCRAEECCGYGGVTPQCFSAPRESQRVVGTRRDSSGQWSSYRDGRMLRVGVVFNGFMVERTNKNVGGWICVGNVNVRGLECLYERVARGARRWSFASFIVAYRIAG